MTTVLHSGLDALATWRRALDRGIEQCTSLLAEQALLDAEGKALGLALRQRLATDRLVVAFVAEFSRGKSELINALFFADTGRRVLPATPGRTTMCPVELAWDGAQPPSLALLPIGTRSGGMTVAALREQPAQWRTLPLPINDPEGMARVLEAVTATERVPVEVARALGFWDDEHPEDNPPCDGQGQVEVPAWRHALINYPHPLLRRGLVVVDTPGLNAIGAEPELTLGLLPSAHATVYVLGADTGVTRSDLAVWRDHLGDRAAERLVVLNKIDALRDPLLSAEQVESQLQQQCASVAATLQIDRSRIFPLSARLALTARVQGDAAALIDSRLPALENALQAQLLPQRSLAIGRMIDEGMLALHQGALRKLAERQRHNADQLFELRSLRGKSGSRLLVIGRRLETEVEDFERCVPRLSALRGVLSKQLQQVMDTLASERVRAAVTAMRREADGSLLKLGAARAFTQMGEALCAMVDEADVQVGEIEEMLAASQRQINADFGFSLASSPRPLLESFRAELGRIEGGYSRYLGITQVWRRAQPGFMDQFIRMLLSKLRVVFESAAVEVELWVKAASAQMDEQLRERRKALAQRRDAFGRIQTAESELERSIQGLEAQELQMQRLSDLLGVQVDQLRQLAASVPAAEPVMEAPAPRLQLVSQPLPAARGAA